MMRCGKTGAVLLHGTGCVRCDCGGAIDPARDDHLVAAFRYSRADPFTVEEIDFPNVASKATAEAMARHQRRIDEELARSIYGSGYANPFASRPDVTDPPWGAPPRRNAVEIITDPNDRRGFDARPIGGPQ